MSTGKKKEKTGIGYKNIKEIFGNGDIKTLFGNGNKEYLISVLRMLNSVAYVKPDEIPNIDLYMDQVTTFMDEHLEGSKRYSDDKLLTKTMINNYTKNSLLPSPEKKKYSKDHMYTMLFIYYLKNILSIADTRSILSPLTDMFFKDKGSIDLKEIYTEIFDIEKEQAASITKDVIKKYYRSKVSFEDVEDEKEKDYLQAFAFISMLCFDVYMKKQMIGKIIDDNFSISYSGKDANKTEGGSAASEEKKVKDDSVKKENTKKKDESVNREESAENEESVKKEESSNTKKKAETGEKKKEAKKKETSAKEKKSGEKTKKE